MQQTVINYQNSMIAAHNDDEVFAAMFRIFAARTGPLHGVAMVCDENAKLNIIGRFGVPKPDELGFCQKLTPPLVDQILKTPAVPASSTRGTRPTCSTRPSAAGSAASPSSPCR